MLLLLLFGLYLTASVVLFWRGSDYFVTAAREGRFPASPYENGEVQWKLRASYNPSAGKPQKGELTLNQSRGALGITLSLDGYKETPITFEHTAHGSTLHGGNGATFHTTGADLTPFRKAWLEAASLLQRVSLKHRFFATLAAAPRLTLVFQANGRTCWRVLTRQGTLDLYSSGAPFQVDLEHGVWQLSIATKKHASPLQLAKHADKYHLSMVEVPAEEFMQSLAEAVRIAAYRFTPRPPPKEGRTHAGKGWMEVRNGHRQLYLTGTPYEIGVQHGKLVGADAEVMARRLVYGVGLLYSIKKGEWFPAEAKKLVERQRPFIHPDYFEEMRGLAEGAQMPLELVQMANIFPEFFHCSGVALMGEATKGGTLLHARVLDYMVGVGLQDYAAVMAVERPGKHRFVTVGYLGFIGSVTGMNEHQVAIGEMGGAGQGDWDGVPMSLLIRQALEECDTLEGVEKLMGDSPRTCEYYYVVSDGKGPKAIGIAATPSKFETFGPGEFHERLQQPVEDAVLVSGPGRYEKLVERVKAGYGEINASRLIEIIRRPVAMKSNLHNVVFEPQALRLLVADATRNTPACDEPYRLYTWDALFSAASSASPQ